MPFSPSLGERSPEPAGQLNRTAAATDIEGVLRRLRDRFSSDTLTALTVTLVSALSLLLLSVAVFGLAATTRTLSERAASLHNTNEAIRAATTARAQVAIAVHGSRVDRTLGSDSSAAVSASLTDARLALGDFSTSAELLADDIDATDFAEAVNASAEAIEQPSSQEERDQNDERLDEAFRPLMSSLIESRNELLRDVEEADGQMGTLGNLASFVVAFLLPTATIFIYQQLARRPRRLAETTFRAEEMHDRQREVGSFTVSVAERLDSALAAGEPVLIARRSRELSSASRLLSGNRRYRMERVAVGDVLSDVARSFQGEAITVGVRPTESVALFDRKAIRTSLELLIESALLRTATMATIEVRNTTDTIDIAVWANGQPLALNLVRQVFIETGSMERGGDDLSRTLLHARTLVEGAGGELVHRTTNDRDGFSLVFPQVLSENLGIASPLGASADRLEA